MDWKSYFDVQLAILVVPLYLAIFKHDRTFKQPDGIRNLIKITFLSFATFNFALLPGVLNLPDWSSQLTLYTAIFGVGGAVENSGRPPLYSYLRTLHDKYIFALGWGVALFTGGLSLQLMPGSWPLVGMLAGYLFMGAIIRVFASPTLRDGWQDSSWKQRKRLPTNTLPIEQKRNRP